MAASELLWALSGRQYGSCEVTVRPCSRRCHSQPYGDFWWSGGRFESGWPYGPTHGGWMAAACGSCRGSCSCNSAAELRLPQPAQSVSEVSVDGVVLPSSAYILYDGRTLVRTDGGQWPFCQDWAAASGVGVFEVTAVFGRPVPALGTLAMGEVIPEMLKACAGTEGCRLPSSVVRSITRQGVSKEFVLARDMAEMRRLGLPVSDRFLDFANPESLTLGAKIWNPDDLISDRRAGGVT